MQEKVKNISRYTRHIELSQFGIEGQIKIQRSKVAVIGAGGLGCPVITYLVAAGIGYLKIIDADSIDISNLQRQFLYSPEHIGASKSQTAAEGMSKFNPNVQIQATNKRLNTDNISELLADFDIIVDCSDNFETRYLLNRFAIRNEKILISGAVSTMNGQLFTFKNGSPCYECLFPPLPDNQQAPACTEAPVLGSVVGTIGVMMATEVIKEIAGLGESLAGKFISLSALNTSFLKTSFSRNPTCETCSNDK